MKRSQLCGLLLLVAGCFAPERAGVPEGGSSEGSSSGAVGTLGAEGPDDPSTGGDDESDADTGPAETTGDVDETTGSSGEPADDATDTTDDTTGGATGSACAPAVFDAVDFDAACFQ